MMVLLATISSRRFAFSVQPQRKVGRRGACCISMLLHQDGVDTDPRHGILRRAAAVHSQPQLPHATAQRERRAVMVRQADRVAPTRSGKHERVRVAQIPYGTKRALVRRQKGRGASAARGTAPDTHSHSRHQRAPSLLAASCCYT